MRAVLVALVAALAAVLGTAALTPAAAADCRDQSGGGASYVFTGKVDRVEANGTKAWVTTAAGTAVVVLGNRPVSQPVRTFLAGETYEFHPVNDASPFEDNACTATRAVGDSKYSPQAILVLVIIVGMVLSAPALARWIRRRTGAAPPDARRGDKAQGGAPGAEDPGGTPPRGAEPSAGTEPPGPAT